ncbi:MAG TPA: protein translocase subunit SecF [Bryobacteraceae bacterium]|nr:protein translocase subunit SecF [Bryobacteraceae bacterium]
MEFFKHSDFDFLGKKWPFIILSLILTAAGLVSLAVKGGPRYGIDFRGGALITVSFAHRPPVDKVRAALSGKVPVEVQEVSGASEDIIGIDAPQQDATLQASRQKVVESLDAAFGVPSNGKYNINAGGAQALADHLRDPLAAASVALSDQQLNTLVGNIMDYRKTHSGLVANLDDLRSVPGVTPQVLNVLKQQTYPDSLAVVGVDVVGPKIGAELQRKAILAVLYALGGMLVYIAFRFEWIYGAAAVIAVFHDTIITIGLFSLFNKEITLTVVAALLTLVGYSMNDTIVTFDRVRENLKLLRREELEPIINKSVNQTLSRTVLTSGLTLLTALALLFFGGQVLNGFAFALTCGIIVGTYSSVFVASPILIFWHNFLEGRKRRTRGAAPKPVSPAPIAAASAVPTPTPAVKTPVSSPASKGRPRRGAAKVK